MEKNLTMINTNDFKIGQTIKLNNDIYQIIHFLHVKPGKGAAFVRSKLKNLKMIMLLNIFLMLVLKLKKH